MRVFVTGATGIVGNAVARLLARKGHQVRALARNLERARMILPPEVELARGDVLEPETLKAAAAGCELVFHAAGIPELWQRDEAVFDRVNRQGTAHVLRAALEAGARRAVYTSTMDVFAAPRGGTLVETLPDAEPKKTAYERSKVAAEREAEAVRAQGLDVVFVNPAAVYGPSPSLTGLNAFFGKLLRGQVPMVPPGGMSVVYVEALALAHLAASEKGRDGERYIVSDGHVSNRELAEAVVRVAGLPRVPPSAPAWLMKALAAVSVPLARAFRFTPLVTPGQLAFVLWDARADASKAVRELGYRPMPLGEGVSNTVEFLEEQGFGTTPRRE